MHRPENLSAEALSVFVPEMERALGPNHISQLAVHDGAGWMYVDFVYPLTTPAVVIEHKSALVKHEAMRQVDSYVVNLAWSGKLKGQVLGVAADNSDILIRTYEDGRITSSWSAADMHALADLVTGKGLEISADLAYELKPTTDMKRYQRDRWRRNTQDPEFRQQRRDYERNRYANDPEFRARKLAANAAAAKRRKERSNA